MHRSLVYLIVSSCIDQAFTNAPVSPSPRASTEIICHTSHASECYPRIFQPSKYFNTVHDDQELPPGLHVRLNLQTGVKEARLNVPEGGEDDYTAVAVLDDEDPQQASSDDDQQPLVPVVNADGHQKGPPRILIPDTANGEERKVFDKSVAILKAASRADVESHLSALADLEELCHSLEWGHVLARDTSMINHLQDIIVSVDVDTRLRSASALLLSTTIRNNLSALEAIGNAPSLPETFVQSVVDIFGSSKDIPLLTRSTSLLSSLCQTDVYLHQLIDNRGLETLVDVFDSQDTVNDNTSKLQSRIANFWYDYLPRLENVVNGEHDKSKGTNPHGGKPANSDKERTEQVSKSLNRMEWSFASYLSGNNERGMPTDEDTAYRSIETAWRALTSRRKSDG